MCNHQKRGIGNIIAIALILVIGVLAVVNFGSWFQYYQTGIISKVSTQTNNNNIAVNSRIENIIGEYLYIASSQDNLSLNKVKFRNVDCNISAVNLTKGINKINISNCLSNAKTGIAEILIVTDKYILSKEIYYKQATLGPLPSQGTDIVTLCSNLIAQYHFDNNSDYGESDTLVYDFSGLGNNKSCSGSSCPTLSTHSKYGKSYFFDGDYFYSSERSPDLFDFGDTSTAQFSVATWLKVNSSCTGNDVYFGRYTTTVSIWMGCDDTKIEFHVRDSNGVSAGSEITSITNMTLDEWYFVVGVYNKTNMSLYINSVLEDHGVIAHTGHLNSSSNVQLGRFITSYYYKGWLDELMVFNKSLSQDEVSELYTLSSPLDCLE